MRPLQSPTPYALHVTAVAGRSSSKPQRREQRGRGLARGAGPVRPRGPGPHCPCAPGAPAPPPKGPTLRLQFSGRTSSLPIPRYTVVARRGEKRIFLKSLMASDLYSLLSLSLVPHTQSITYLKKLTLSYCYPKISLRAMKSKSRPLQNHYLKKRKKPWDGGFDAVSKPLLRGNPHLGTSAAARQISPLPPPFCSSRALQAGWGWGCRKGKTSPRLCPDRFRIPPIPEPLENPLLRPALYSPSASPFP